MGVVNFGHELESPISPDRLFKALIIDSHNLIPKIMPQRIQSIALIEGDGGVGSIRQVNFTPGRYYKYAKHRVEEMDEENFMCKYRIIEGDVLKGNLKSIVYEVKLEADKYEGCICKVWSTYETEGDVMYKDEDIEAGKDRAMEMYKAIEAYLFANPRAYA
ncbi:Bet v I/Major latex protein [Dillenia turbinata]|uniref:Bet v I/Major latex protein n=1 Tax=Dillenia turbinata TaxID=194707 RepID=A0AAN8W479_9MAGN